MVFGQAVQWGGGDSRPVPMRIPGLVSWHSAKYSKMFQDSAATTVANAATNPVGHIADVSGNGFHFLQTVDADRPLLAEVTGGLVPNLDGASDLWTIAHNNIFHTPPFTAVVRFRMDVVPSAGEAAQVFSKLDSGSVFAWLFQVDGSDRLRWFMKDAGAVSKNIIGSALSGSTWYTAIATVDASFDSELFLGASTQGTVTATSFLTSDGDAALGARSATSSRLNGQISDALFYSHVLTADERAMLLEVL